MLIPSPCHSDSERQTVKEGRGISTPAHKIQVCCASRGLSQRAIYVTVAMRIDTPSSIRFWGR